MVPGELLGRGLRSTVHRWGDDDAVKVAFASTPSGWILEELRLVDSAAHSGAPVAARRRLVDVDGRPALASERLDGSSLWEELVDDPARATEVGSTLARIQLHLASHRPSYAMPRQRDRIVAKIRLAAARHDESLLDALRLLPADSPTADVLCHGDLHPRNVIITDRGPVLVDWFDAGRGLLVADVARTALMLEVSGALGDDAVPASAIDAMRTSYLEEMTTSAAVVEADVARWIVVQRIARLSEGVGDLDIVDVRARLAGELERLR